MTENAISSIGLLLLIVPFLVHGIEVLWPMQARWVVNWVLPFFAPMLPCPSKSLQLREQLAMLDAAVEAVPVEKRRAGEDYVFLLLFEQRQGAIGFAAATAGALYGLNLGIADRDALHFVFGVIAVLMTLVNANQAGVPFLGNHPRMSVSGKHVGWVFTPFWMAVAAINWLGFTYAVA